MRSLFIYGLILLIMLALPGTVVFAMDLLGHGPDVNAWLEQKFNISHRVALAIPAAVMLFFLPPMIVLLYFLRLKRTAVSVPSTFLWKKSVEDLHVNRLMQWLRRNVLLLLQLLAVLLLIYAALGPRTHGAVFGGRHYILMIDYSASMSATDTMPSYPNRLEWAKDAALRQIDAASDTDSGMLIVFHSTAEIRQSYTTNREELRAAVRAVTESVFPTRIDEALNLAASRANPDRSTANESVAPQNPEPGKERTYVQNEGMQAEMHLFSDGKFPNVPDFALANLNLTYHAPQAKEASLFADNVGIVRLTAERDPNDPTRLYIRGNIQSFRDQAGQNAKVILDVRDYDDKLVVAYTKTVPLGIPPEKKFAEGEAVFELLDIAENADLLVHMKLDMQPADAFPHDNQAWLVVGQIHKARVLVITPGNRILKNYFDTPAAKKLADFVYASPAEWSDPGAGELSRRAREGKFDLVVFDRTGPTTEETMPAANTLFIGHAPPPYHMTAVVPNDPLAVVPMIGPRISSWQSAHPTMRTLRRLDEIRIAEAFRLPFLPPKTPRLLEGDQDQVLLAALPRRSYTDLVLTFPLVSANADGPDRVWHSDWPLQPSFVLFLRNVLITYGDVRESTTMASLQPGDVTPLRLRTTEKATVIKPDGHREELDPGKRAGVAYSGTDKLGVYRVKWPRQDTEDSKWQDENRRFAVNLFDPAESDIAPSTEVKIGNVTMAAEQASRQPFELWKVFVAGGLFVLLAEWWIYNKRVQI